MKTIAIIPARGGSKRLPSKNTLLIGGIPLVAHSILYAKKNSEIIDEIYVSTDDEAIKEIALLYGAQVINRPPNLSGDFEPTASVLKHVLESLDFEVENVILLQPTNPFREAKLLKEAFQIYKDQNHESLFTVTQIHQKLGKIVNNSYQAFNYIIGQRSQDLAPLYFENGLLYISKARLIHEGKIISSNAFPYKVDSIFSKVDIDTQDDLDYAEYLFNKFIIHNS